MLSKFESLLLLAQQEMKRDCPEDACENDPEFGALGVGEGMLGIGGGKVDVSVVQDELCKPCEMPQPLCDALKDIDNDSANVTKHADFYVPQLRKNCAQSPVWFFARMSSQDDILNDSGKLNYFRAWCMVVNCHHREIVKGPTKERGNKHNTKNIADHMLSHHGVDVHMMREQRDGKCTCGSEKCKAAVPHAAPGTRREQIAAKKRARREASTRETEKKTNGLFASGDVLLPLRSADEKSQQKCTEAWVRLVVVQDLRLQSITEGHAARSLRTRPSSRNSASFGI